MKIKKKKKILHFYFNYTNHLVKKKINFKSLYKKNFVIIKKNTRQE